MKSSWSLFKIFMIDLALLMSIIVIFDLIKENNELKKQPPERVIIENDVSPISYDYIGEFTLSHYCDCPICTGTAKGSRTASGVKPKEGLTIACDGKYLKMGDIVFIENYGVRMCQDKGGNIKNKRIDVFYENHQKAKNMGIKKAKVYKLN